jgi:hypothetical protein
MSISEILELKELQEILFIQTTLSLRQWFRLEELEQKER